MALELHFAIQAQYETGYGDIMKITIGSIQTLICYFLMLVPLASIGSELEEEEIITVGIVPQQSAATLVRNWAPLLDYMSEQTGLKLVFRTAPDIPTFESRVLRGEYDLAYMNPYHYAVYSIQPGYRAFAHQEDKLIEGIIIVRKDTDITQLEELEGRQLAFPSPAAFAASMLPRSELQKQKIDFTAKYVGSHASVYKSVAKGLYPAGGGIQRTFNAIDESVRSQLKILWKSNGYTPHAFAAHPRVSNQVVNLIQKELVDMDTTVKGKELLSNIKFKSVKAADDEEWDSIRFLDLVETDWLLKGSE